MKFSFMRYKKIVLLTVLALSGCAVGPDYVAPSQETGTSFKTIKEGQWVQADPSDSLSKGDWWTRFQEPELNYLMATLNQANLNIVKAAAQYQAAVAQTSQARAGLFPSLKADAGRSRSGGSNQAAASRYALNGTLSWELDLWGKVRREIESQDMQAQASAATLANIRLSMQGELAKNYFSLRILDLRKRLLSQIVASYERSVKDNTNRYNQGVAARADVINAQVQLENARVQELQAVSERQVLESSIAVLLGQAPSSFSLPEQAFVMHLPTVPVDIPSVLLQRRPDIGAAERQMAAANAQIGVAQSAWFPNLNFTTSGQLTANHFSDWIQSPLNVWSLGPALVATLFDGGARSANVKVAKAGYQAEVATYRQTVLTALKEVDDALLTWTVLAQEQVPQTNALAAARSALQIAHNQYNAGLIDYLSLIQVENTTHNAEIADLNLQNQRLQVAIQLILALGGGWSGIQE